MRKYQLLVVLTAFSAISCRGSTAPRVETRLTPERFIDAMVAVELAAPAERAALLKKKSASEADLREFVQKYSAADPTHLSIMFDSIQTRIDRAHAAKP